MTLLRGGGKLAPDRSHPGRFFLWFSRTLPNRSPSCCSTRKYSCTSQSLFPQFNPNWTCCYIARERHNSGQHVHGPSSKRSTRRRREAGVQSLTTSLLIGTNVFLLLTVAVQAATLVKAVYASHIREERNHPVTGWSRA